MTKCSIIVEIIIVKLTNRHTNTDVQICPRGKFSIHLNRKPYAYW